MQNQFRLSLAEVARIIEAATYHCPFDQAIDILATVCYEERFRTVSIRSEASAAVELLKTYGHWEVEDISVADTSHGQIVLKIGTVSVQDMSMFPILISLQTLVGNIPYEPCEDAEDMEDDGPEYPEVVKTLGDMLREKFGDI